MPTPADRPVAGSRSLDRCLPYLFGPHRVRTRVDLPQSVSRIEPAPSRTTRVQGRALRGGFAAHQVGGVGDRRGAPRSDAALRRWARGRIVPPARPGRGSGDVVRELVLGPSLHGDVTGTPA